MLFDVSATAWASTGALLNGEVKERPPKQEWRTVLYPQSLVVSELSKSRLDRMSSFHASAILVSVSLQH